MLMPDESPDYYDPEIFTDPGVIDPGEGYPPATVPTTETPTFRVTAYAPKTDGMPWWAWLLVGIVGYQFLKRK